MMTPGKDAAIDPLRQCKYFHYIGVDHDVMREGMVSHLERLQQELEKKKGMIEKIMNKDPNILKEMVKFFK